MSLSAAQAIGNGRAIQAKTEGWLIDGALLMPGRILSLSGGWMARF